MGSRVTSGHPSKQLSIVDDEVAVGELMRVEEEGRDRQRQNRDPEIDEVWRPEGQSDVKQQHKRSQSQVDGGASKTRVKNAKRDPRGGKSSPCRDVSSSTKVEIVEDRVSVDLGREDLKDRRQRHEVLGQSNDGSSCTSFRQFLQEQGQEGDEEHDENRDDASLNPLVNGNQVVTT